MVSLTFHGESLSSLLSGGHILTAYSTIHLGKCGFFAPAISAADPYWRKSGYKQPIFVLSRPLAFILPFCLAVVPMFVLFADIKNMVQSACGQ